MSALRPGCVLSVLLTAAPVLGGVTPDDLCAGDPCVITANANLAGQGDLGLDFGDRDVVIEAVVDVGDASLRLDAQNLEIRGSGQLRGLESMVLNATGDLVLDGRRESGVIRMVADGASLTLIGEFVSVRGALVLNGSDPDADGGVIVISSASDVSVTGEVQATSGTLGEGGSLDVSAVGDVLLRGSIDLSGGEFGGGSLSVLTEGRVVLGAAVVDGNGELSDAGSVEIASGADVELTGRIRGRGSATAGDDCGDGGLLDLDIEGNLLIAGDIDFRARAGDCCGGDASIAAGDVSVGGEVNFGGTSGDGCGGSISIEVSRRFVCSGVIDVSADDFGGDLTVVSGGDQLVTSACNLLATGPVGSIKVVAGGAIQSDGTYLAGETSVGGGRGGSLGDIDLSACSMALGRSARLESAGAGAKNRLVARGSVSIAGTLKAEAANEVVVPNGIVPIIAGTADPDLTLIVDPQLVPCGGQVTVTPTATPTSTPTTTATSTATFSPTDVPPSATATLTPVPPSATPTETQVSVCGGRCAGDCDGNCVVGINELVTAVQISLTRGPTDACLAADRSGDGLIAINELVAAVRSALSGCPRV